jgi:hypothetical protein
MIYTNKHNLPQVIVDALLQDTYSKGDADASVTELLTPPQMRKLIIKHDDEIVVDVSDMLAALQGRAMHYIMELAATGKYNMLTEKSIYSMYNGWKIKGQFDHVLIGEGILIDFKTCSYYKVANDARPMEWIQQTNIYKRLLQKEVGLVVNRIQVVAFVKDFNKRKAKTTAGYPPAGLVSLDIPVWEDDAIDALIEERIRLHKESDPRPCTDSDIWARPAQYAVMKRGRMKALRLFDTAQEAEEMASTSVGLHVEYRPGEAVRCQDWCLAAPFCTQWQADPRNTTQTQSTTESLFDAKV